jgi:hypothetical protein
MRHADHRMVIKRALRRVLNDDMSVNESLVLLYKGIQIVRAVTPSLRRALCQEDPFWSRNSGYAVRASIAPLSSRLEHELRVLFATCQLDKHAIVLQKCQI